MSFQELTPKNNKSARKLHGKFPKGDVRHWSNRVKKEGSPDYGVQILFKGHRQRFALKTANKETAARKALSIYQSLVANGWETTLAKYKPESAKADKIATIGELLVAVQKSAGIRANTFKAYSQALRSIASQIAGIGDQPSIGDDGKPLRNKDGGIIYKVRRDYQTGGRDAWIAKVESLPLTIFTPADVQQWRIAYIAKVGDSPDKRRRAENSCTALIRNARALFSEKALSFAKDRLLLPSPLPFSGIKLSKGANTRYVSKIDAESLIKQASDELTKHCYHIFLLAQLCGLRKNEIDLLIWDQVDFEKSVIRIERTEWFEPKSEDSIAAVDLDTELVIRMKAWKQDSTGPFVIDSTLKPKRGSYRCERHFKKLYVWLREKGIIAQKPMHELRKELGAILATNNGIFAAQSVLRHAQIATTAGYYVDKKRAITANLGKHL